RPPRRDRRVAQGQTRRRGRQGERTRRAPQGRREGPRRAAPVQGHAAGQSVDRREGQNRRRLHRRRGEDRRRRQGLTERLPRRGGGPAPERRGRVHGRRRRLTVALRRGGQGRPGEG